MNAQKLANNKIALSSKAVRKDAIEVIEDLKVSEFFRLSRAAKTWSENLDDKRDIIFTTYENENSKVCKEFDKIIQRRKLFEVKLNEIKLEEDSKATSICKSEDGIKLIEDIPPEAITSNVKEKAISYNSTIKGTSRLLRIPKKQIIKIVRRKGLIDDNNRPNSVCISNTMREDFFHDVKQSKHFSTYGLYEIMYSEEDKNYYEKWDKLMVKINEEGLQKCANAMNSAKN